MAVTIPEEKIREVRNAADIYEIISESVALKKTGKNYQGLCPFHAEKTPSFSVNPAKQIFYCFGCGVGGDAISFLMKKDGFSFPEAVRELARRTGVDLPVEQLTPEQKQRVTEREKLLKVNRIAKEFYQNRLKSPEGDAARRYLENRGIDADTIETFHLGYAPDGWDHLATHFRRRRFPVPESYARKVGLIVPRKTGNGCYDSFRNRIIFPIFNLSRQVIGFGGRVMDSSMPKYLNTQETPVYNKGRSLYGIENAKQRAREKEAVFIVEGYLDLIAMHKNGFRHTVATLGTALTADHVRMLKGLVGKRGRVVLVFDSDNAGIKAAERSIDVFAGELMDAYILVLGDGHDPDSFLAEYGPERFENAATRAMSTLSFLAEMSVKRNGLTPEGKIRIITEMKGPLSSVEDPVARSLYVKSLCERIDVDEMAVMERIKAAQGDPGRGRAAGKNVSDRAVAPRRSAIDRIEERIVAMALQYPSIMPEIKKRGLADMITNRDLKLIVGALYGMGSKEVTTAAVLDAIESARVKSLAASLAVGDEQWDRQSCMKLINQFESSRKRQDRSLLKDIRAAEAADDPEALARLLKEKMEQAREKTSSFKKRRVS